MELRNPKKDEKEKPLEPAVVENEKDAGNDDEVVAEFVAEKGENEVVETSAGEKTKEDENFAETCIDVEEENKTENGTVEKPSVLAPVEASSSGMKKPQGLPAKNKIIKKVKKLVKKKISKGTTVLVAGEKNVTVEQGVKEVITVVNNEKDEESAEPFLGESEKEIEKVIESGADSPQHSLGGSDMESNKELEDFAEALADDNEKVAGAEPSGEGTLKKVKGKASTVKRVGRRLIKGGEFKGSLAQGKGKEIATMLQGAKEGVDLDSMASPGGNATEAEKAIEGSVEAPENGVEKSNLLEVNTNEGGQQMTLAVESKQNQLTENKAGSAEGKRRKKKRRGKQILGANKKQKKEVGAPSAAVVAGGTQKNMEEKKEEVADPENKKKEGEGKAKIGGLIFMCNGKTKTDCFKFSVMGVQEKRKDYVMGIKPGVKLFLYDYDLKLLYGVFQASSAGGMKLERNAFGGSFPAQVRFKVVKDCIPLPERQFKNAIKENYNNRNKFKTELTYKQVFKLTKLFRPAPLTAQVTLTQPIPVARNGDRKRTNKDRRFAAGSSRTGQNRANERSRRNDTRAPPPRREEPPRDLFLSEREYRTYGLRRGGGEETSQQHYPIPPPDSSYHRDRVPLDSYHPSSVDHDRLLRQADIERRDLDHERLLRQAEIVGHDRGREREVRGLRDYDRYDHHLSSRREILSRNSPNPPASVVALDSYRRDRDPYYSYEYRDRALERQQPPRTYLTSSAREEDDLYSRYVTPDSLAEYYRSSSRRYPSLVESELPPPSSRYATYSGSLPYSHR